jgi:hypothetical protein
MVIANGYMTGPTVELSGGLHFYLAHPPLIPPDPQRGIHDSHPVDVV